MRRFGSIAEFMAFTRSELPALIAEGKRAGAQAGGDIVLAEIQAEIGTYQAGDAGFEDMEKLHKATLEGFGPLPGKIADGYAPPDNPLLRDGTLRDSFGVSADETGSSIGSNDPVAIYQNEGTDERGVPFVKGATTSPGISGREFIGRAGFRKAPEVAAAIGENVVGYMTGAKTK